MNDKDIRVERMLLSLEGLSVGDAFGEQFFFHRHLLNGKALPLGPWPYTDDTLMALSIVSILMRKGHIDQDMLAANFAENYTPSRGYGQAMHIGLPQVKRGADWREVFGSLFHGEGSYGNGASMRVAPLGAFFSGNLDEAVKNAALSAQVTHHHPEATAGAIAVAAGAAIAGEQNYLERHDFHGFIEEIIKWVPSSLTRDGISSALELGPEASIGQVARELGSGFRVTTQDTVPFVIWCTSRFMGFYEKALWKTVSGGGDLDTTCAMVGGVVVMSSGFEGIPLEWLRRREPLPNSPI